VSGGSCLREQGAASVSRLSDELGGRGVRCSEWGSAAPGRPSLNFLRRSNLPLQMTIVPMIEYFYSRSQRSGAFLLKISSRSAKGILPDSIRCRLPSTAPKKLTSPPCQGTGVRPSREHPFNVRSFDASKANRVMMQGSMRRSRLARMLKVFKIIGWCNPRAHVRECVHLNAA